MAAESKKDLRKFWKKIGEHNITHYISTFVNLEIDGLYNLFKVKIRLKSVFQGQNHILK